MTAETGAGRATIAFDLDGTLAHTAPDIVRAINTVLLAEGLAVIAPAEALDLINLGAGARKLIENAFRVAGRVLDAPMAETMVRRYLDAYLADVYRDSRLYPGCRDALDCLAARGHRLVVCTNKPERHARALLAALDVATMFATIAGIDTYAYCKPDGRHLTMAVASAGGDPRRAVMVGDSHVDVSAARSAGVPIVCVSFGYTSVPVAQLHPDRVIDHFSELVDAVRSVERLGWAAAADR
jgi:phosphoglycolate phosphatase